jgi:WD40 repeat protein
VFLYDACRNAPFGEGVVKEADGRSVRAFDAGPARIEAAESEAASQAGLFIAYATSPGKTADDAWGPEGSAHSPFTEALLKNLPTPGVVIEEALLKAYYAIGELTGWRQTPWTSSSLTAEVRLNGVLEAAQVQVEASERAARSLAAAQLGLRGAGVVAALKGLPRRWIDTEDAATFSAGRAHLFSLMRGPELTLRGHNDSTQSASISPDSSRIVTAAEDVRVWDAATGTELQRFEYDVRLAAYSPDGRQMFMGGRLVPAAAAPGGEGESRLDDPNLHLDYRVFAYSPDGRKGVTSSEKRIGDTLVDAVEIWDMRTGKLLRTLEGAREVDSAAFSPDGRRVVTGQEHPGEVRLWDAETGKAVGKFSVDGKEVTHTAYFKDGPRAIVRDFENPADVAIWRVGAGAETVPLQNVASGFGRFEVKYGFSPDGRLVAGATAQGVSFWDAATGEKLSEGGDVSSGQSIDWMSFSPDGGLVVTAALDRTARLWSAARPLRLRSKGASSGVIGIAFSGDGRRIAAKQGDNVRLFDSRNGEELLALPGRFIDSTYLSANGRRVALSDHDSGSLWNAETGVRIAEFEGRVFAFSPDGARGLSASPAGAAIWDAGSGKTQLTLQGGEGATLKHAAFSADGRRVVTAWSDCVNLVSDAKDGRAIQVLRWKPPKLEPGFSIACNSSEHAQFSGDGRRILTYGYGSGTIWDAQTGEELSKIGPEEDITHAVLSPDGRHVFASTWEQAGKIFDADTGRPVATLAERVSKASAFSPDGQRVLGFGDSKVALFDALTGAKLEDFDADVAAFSHDGTRIAAGGFFGPALVRDAGVFGPELLEAAYDLLTDEQRAEVERERIRYWEIDPALLR